MKGFLGQRAVTSAEPMRKTPACHSCGLKNGCQSPLMPVDGNGEHKILFVDSFPTVEDDDDGRWLSGPGGELIRTQVDLLGYSFDESCWSTGALICHPKKTPKPENFKACLPALLTTIQQLKPNVIVPLSQVALRSVLHKHWKDGIGSYDRWVGWSIPSHVYNAWVCPIFSPSHVRKFERDKALQVIFKRQLEHVFSIEDKPFVDVPNYRKQVEVVSPQKAAAMIKQMIAKGGAVSFDYETNMLKPDSELARILCVGVCWRGKKTIAYPFVGPAVDATRELLRSPLPKIGANLQFEERWSRAVLKTGVRNWRWDCVQAAHVLDNREEITGVKFQAFVRLGIPLYNTLLESAMKSAKGGNDLNQLPHADQQELLSYCGLDSIAEYLVAVDQMDEMGIEFGDL